MSTIKISELATSNIALTDFFAKADATGVANKNTVQELSNLLKTVDDTAFKGSIAIADVPSENGWYFASESGTYTNCGGLVIDTSDNIAIIIVSGTFDIFNEINIPVNITIDVVPTIGSTNAVGSGGVFDAINSAIIGYSTTFTNGFYLNSSGSPTAGATLSYTDYIPVTVGDWYMSRAIQFAGAIYDENKTFIRSFGENPAVNDYLLAISDAEKFIRLNITITEQTTYIFTKHYIDKYAKKETIVELIEANTIPSEKLTDKTNLNLLFEPNWVDGFYLNTNEVITASAPFAYNSNYIKVEPNTTYIKGRGLEFAGSNYDQNKGYISRLQLTPSVWGVEFTTGSTTEYVRLNSLLTTKNDDYLYLKNEYTFTNFAVRFPEQSPTLLRDSYLENTNMFQINTFDYSSHSITGNILVIGDSTVASYLGSPATSSFLYATGTKTDISNPGDTITDQLTAYNALTVGVKSAVNYAFVQIGQNDKDPNVSLATTLGLYQDLIDQISTDSPSAVIITASMTPSRLRTINFWGQVNGALSLQKFFDMNDAIMGLGSTPITGFDKTTNTHYY